MIKRNLIIAFSVLFLVTALWFPSAEETAYGASPPVFTDVPQDYWGRSYISFSAEVGIVNGYLQENGSYLFRPDNPVSKEESMQMIYKAVVNSGIGPAFSEELPAKYENLLTEAGIAAWAWECVSYGLENDILEVGELAGFRTGSRDPAPAAREEVARWTAKAVDRELMPAIALDYTDADQIAEENLPYVDLLNRTSIMIGDSTGKFNPKASIRRVEFAVICNKVYALAEAGFDIAAENRSLRGTITSVNGVAGRIYVTTDEGASKVIHLKDKIEIVINGKLAYNGFSSIPTGRKVVLAWGPFGQIHIASEVVVGEAVINRLTSVSRDCMEMELRLNNGELVYYFIDGETSVIDKPMEGQNVIFIADGVKIIEIAENN